MTACMASAASAATASVGRIEAPTMSATPSAGMTVFHTIADDTIRGPWL